VNLLQSTGADVATITECKIPEGSGELSVAGYTTFAPTPSLQGGKTRVLILVKNDLAVRANVKVIADIMDPAVQLVCVCVNVYFLEKMVAIQKIISGHLSLFRIH
jgi:hypothetical protein